MALLGFLGISEGLELLLLLFVLILLALFIVRRILFSLRLRRVRRENMELARHMKTKLKSARFRSSSDFDQEDDEMFRPSIRAKVPVIPASYEARLAKTRKKATRKRRAKHTARKTRTRKARKR
jgi:type II secretory pathway pseudopilin PulG